VNQWNGKLPLGAIVQLNRAYTNIVPIALSGLLPDSKLLGLRPINGRQATPRETMSVLETFISKMKAHLPKSTIDGVERWEQGWGEILARLENQPFSTSLLVPQYYKYNLISIDHQFFYFDDPLTEYKLFEELRNHLVETYTAGFENIYELGCGTGHNLIRIVDAVSESVKVTGCDFAATSGKIIDNFPQKYRSRIEFQHLDMLKMKRGCNFRFEPGSLVFTFLSLEQLADQFQPLLDHLLQSGVRRVVNVEPITEFYDKRYMDDSIFSLYHEHRNYLQGYLFSLKNLQAHNKIDIVQEWKSRFSAGFHNPYSVIAWDIM
jgi:SAM-dependent methyltransferase